MLSVKKQNTCKSSFLTKKGALKIIIMIIILPLEMFVRFVSTCNMSIVEDTPIFIILTISLACLI